MLRQLALALSLLGMACKQGDKTVARQTDLATASDSSIQVGRTKLQAFNAKTGAVIVRGFSKVGSVRGLYGTSVSAEARELTDATDGTKVSGIAIEVVEGGSYEKSETSYIDYDEIESLLKGIDYIAKIDKGATRLDDFQADYRTRGDFSISTFSGSTGGTMVSVRSGEIGSASAFYPIDKLPALRDLITQTKARLDSIKAGR